LYWNFSRFSLENKIFQDVETLIIAVSGGVDSMVMLTLLYELKRIFGYEMIVAHFNHLYRGELANQDEKIVLEYCNKLGVKFQADRQDVMKYSVQKKISFEMAGRELRYKFFNRIAKNYNNAKIVTAHILSDNTETILLRIIKGTGLNGIKGIQPKIRNLLRPLLFASKKQLYQYAKTKNIPFNDDHTNFENDCQRNIVRNKLLPVINEINPQIDQSIQRLSTIVHQQLDFSQKIADEIFRKIIKTDKIYFLEIDIKELQNQTATIQSEIIFRAIRHINCEIKNHPPFHYMEKIENLLTNSKTGKFIRIFENVILLKNRNKLSLFNENLLNWKKFNIDLEKIYKRVSFIFSTKFVKFGNFSDINNSIELIDAEKIKGQLKLRHWKEGDRFIPFGNKFVKKLSNYFIDTKVSRFEKLHTPILVDDEKIIWICGMQLSNEVRVSDSTRKILKLEYKELNNVR